MKERYLLWPVVAILIGFCMLGGIAALYNVEQVKPYSEEQYYDARCNGRPGYGPATLGQPLTEEAALPERGSETQNEVDAYCVALGGSRLMYSTLQVTLVASVTTVLAFIAAAAAALGLAWQIRQAERKMRRSEDGGSGGSITDDGDCRSLRIAVNASRSDVSVEVERDNAKAERER